MLILVVDGNESELALTRSLLTGARQVIGLGSAAQALAFCAHTTPDCVLLEVRLPDMNGVRLLTELRKSPDLQNLPIVMLTAYGSAESAVESLKAGAFDHLNKNDLQVPLLCSALEEAVRQGCVKQLKRSDHHRLVQENFELTRRQQQLASYWAGISGKLLGSVGAAQSLVTQLIDDSPQADVEQQRKKLARTRGICSTVQNEIQQLQEVVGLSRSPGKMTWQSTNLAEALAPVLLSIEFDALECRVAVHSVLPPDVQVFTDQYLLCQILYEIAQQALLLATQGSTLEVRGSVCRDGLIQLKLRVDCVDEAAAIARGRHLELQISEALSAANASPLSTVASSRTGTQISFELTEC